MTDQDEERFNARHAELWLKLMQRRRDRGADDPELRKIAQQLVNLEGRNISVDNILGRLAQSDRFSQ